MKTIKISKIHNGDAFTADEVSHVKQMMESIIHEVEIYLSQSEDVILDFDNVNPHTIFSALGLLAYNVFYKWDKKKINITNMSSEVMDYFVSSVVLYNQREREYHEEIVKAFQKAFGISNNKLN